MSWTHACGIPSPPDQIIPALAETAQGWINELWAKGTAVDTPVRLQAIAVLPEMDDPLRPLATLSISLSPLALSWDEATTKLNEGTPALLISEPGVMAELRARRADVIAGDYARFNGDPLVLPVKQEGVLYFVYFRDTIPIEDSDGLIRPPTP